MLRGVVVTIAVATLLLAGWGVSDLDGFFEDTPRVLGASVACLGAFLAAPGMRFRTATRTEARGQEWFAVGNLFVYAMALWLFPFLDARRELASYLRVDGTGFRWAGVVFVAGGQTLMAWAIHSLRHFFTAKIGILPGHQLVDTGPYALLRHPFYTGVFLTVVGFPAVFGSWVGLVAAVIVLPPMILRMNVEERLLQAEFGEAYEKMKARTWRIIPFIH